MVAFPFLATVISLACAIVATRRYVARHRAYELSWAIAFGFFALGAGAATLGYLIGWTPLLVRLFYASGAILTTAFLGFGSLYLLLGSRLDRWGPGAIMIVTAFTFASVFNTTVDPARLGEAWYALQTAGTPTRVLAIVANVFGATVVVGGALYSVSVGLKRGMPRDRAFGVLLIAIGTLVVASGSSLIRLTGDTAFLFVAMAPGVAIIMGGYLLANRAPRLQPSPAVVAPATALLPTAEGAEQAASNGYRPATLPVPVTAAPAAPAATPPRPRRETPPAALREPPTAAAAVRILGPDDVAAVRAIAAQGDWPSAFLAGLPYLRDTVLAAELDGEAALWLGLMREGRLVAVARVLPGDRPAARHTAHLDFLLAPDAALTAALLGAVLAWAQDHLGLVRLSAWAWPDDECGLGVLDARGFVREGTLRAALFTAGSHRDVAALAWVVVGPT
jgi:RimJ/RimL family protein N-acetyltransferase